MGVRGITLGNIFNCNMQICAFLCILRQPLRQIICTVSMLFTIRKTTMTNFGGCKIFRFRLTKYCRGCVPGGVDAPAVNTHCRSHERKMIGKTTLYKYSGLSFDEFAERVSYSKILSLLFNKHGHISAPNAKYIYRTQKVAICFSEWQIVSLTSSGKVAPCNKLRVNYRTPPLTGWTLPLPSFSWSRNNCKARSNDSIKLIVACSR